MQYPDDVNYWKELAEKYSDALAEMVEAKNEFKETADRHYAKIQELHEELEEVKSELSELQDEHRRMTSDMKEIQHYAKGW